MIDRLTNNFRIKIISLLTALLLWSYVIMTVDPEKTKLYEDIPLTITNLAELTEQGLMIYPESQDELTVDIYISAQLSILQSIETDEITVYGKINDPIEGKNEVILSVRTPQKTSYELRDSVMIINLEKIVQEEKNIEVIIADESKDKIDDIEFENSINSVNITGPRSLVDQVEKVVADLDINGEINDFETTLDLKPVDEEGNIVTGVDLDIQSIEAKITLLQEKTVPIRVEFIGDESDNYKLSHEYINIKGKKEIINQIEYISTQQVDISEIENNMTKEVELNIPNGIESDIKYITIEIDTLNRITEEFVYDSKDIQIRNMGEDFDISQLEIPHTIKVIIKYDSSIGEVSKEDIVLYVDLNQEIEEDGKYNIEYESEYELYYISITPNTTD